MDSTHSRRHVSIGLALFCIMLLCGFSVPTNLILKTSGVAPSYRFVDARPSSQFKSGQESLFVSSCAYGSFRVGDKDFTPSLATAVNEMLVRRFNDALRGKTIKLVNFTVHQNNATQARAGMSNMAQGMGLIAELAVDKLANDHRVTGCSADDLRGGYVVSEVEPGKIPFVVVVDLEIDSQPVHARWVQVANTDPKRQGADRAERRALQQQAWDEAISSAIDHALAKLGDAVGQTLDPQEQGSVVAPVPGPSTSPAAAPSS